MQSYYSCGKLLITGEYLVLRGARGLALPTSRGQHLNVHESESDHLTWKSSDDRGDIWFECTIDVGAWSIKESADRGIADKLLRILEVCTSLRPEFKSELRRSKVETLLEFPRDWGLGSSSTLVHNIAQWAKVDAFELIERTIGGSGYDVKVAEHECPILFSRDRSRAIAREVEFSPPYADRLWFVHLGRKQDSTRAVSDFKKIQVSDRDIDQISRISDETINASELDGFVRLIQEHDLLLSRILSQPSADEHFSGYTAGYVKYLGAWGGDFVLVTGGESDLDYFKGRGLGTILSYHNMIRT